ncbi:MAG: sigma-54 dependent transcriptional regulator, partial [Candidatus Sumerlaeota bacterium]|nr:sigma-54 dependent transcriptional regulator [Candidatus Sumerlaeota bacterium]
MRRRLLIIDDEKNTRDGLKWALESKPLEIDLAADGAEAWDRIRRQDYHIIITDIKMPGVDGMELLRRIKERAPQTDVIMLTGHGTIESARDAIKMGAANYLTKPVDLDEIGNEVDRCLQSQEMREENVALRQQLETHYGFENIIASSPPMMKVFEQVRLVSQARSTVLLQGESGTGKELIAGAIHYHSPRKNMPLIKVNCGALSPTLLESEIFGHEKGAFTHAFAQKAGRFELANGGTLFLDEVSETTPEFQVKLLRVLQEGEFERVGGAETLKVDVRVVAATNRNLEGLVKEGRFREDLYFRLNVIQITLPPLRDRPEDIPLLAHHFVKEVSQENSREIMDVTPRAMAALQSYSWPGNVRELHNVIESVI